MPPTTTDDPLAAARTYITAGRLPEAAAGFRAAAGRDPADAMAWLGLAGVCWRRGDMVGATEGYRRATELRPDDPYPHSDYLHLLHYDPARSPEELCRAAVRWGERFDPCGAGSGVLGVGSDRPAALDVERRALDVGRSEQGALPAGERPTLDVQRPTSNGDRPLRVGYVSGALREHPVGRFMRRLLAHHDRSQVVVYCYDHTPEPDGLTAKLRRLACAWRDVLGQDCAALADRVRRDRIDVLVDLTGHLGDHRLLAFARRPAPVQVTYLGYPDTTGMRSIGYRITDAWHDPPGQTEQWHTEELVRLPRCCWTYDAGESPDVNELPALATGHVTFGCLNRPVKITPAMIRIWSRILGRIPGSRLMILIDKGCVHDTELQQKFRTNGVDPERMTVCSRRPRPDYLRLFHKVDVGLDTFPYNGHTTTLDALWMGVPTVSLAGKTHVQRAGLSVLSAVGLGELAPATEDEYVETAVRLVSDLPTLAELRGTLRARTSASPLCDGPGLARALESAYRAMFENFMAKPDRSPATPLTPRHTTAR